MKNWPGFPWTPLEDVAAGKKVVVTGCFDWFHSGHVAFFEEAARLGGVIRHRGPRRNIALLKGKGHPLFPQAERLYMVQSVRFVGQALISTGNGWMDAEPEILALKPDIYAVNEDGDVPEKREFCARHGIEYRVLKRLPKTGLTPRYSTDLAHSDSVVTGHADEDPALSVGCLAYTARMAADPMEPGGRGSMMIHGGSTHEASGC